MIRVGIPTIGGDQWPAGRIYLWNLLFAISKLPARRVQPIVIHNPDFDPTDFRDLEAEFFSSTPLLARRSVRLAGRAFKYVMGRDRVIEATLRRARVDLFSHGPPLGRRSAMRQAAWIPDLQHLRLPHLFSAVERALRDHAFRDAVRDATVVIVSSNAALEDLAELTGPDGRRKARVLHFVSQPRVEPSSLPGPPALRQKYELPERYFHLPNQFWRHKNHRLVVDALAHAVAVEPDITVVCTGSSDDYRDRSYYPSLMARVAEARLTERFRHIGVVPFTDLMALMKHSVAVINPSRFEGWSTTVEEAKSLGKIVLASSIPVHREQAPLRAHYFDPDDPQELAVILTDVWRKADAPADAHAALEASSALSERTRTFATAYEQIVIEAVDGR